MTLQVPLVCGVPESPAASAVAPAPATPSSARSLTLIVFSGDFDKWVAAFSLATSAAAMGSEVTMYFTFWGLLGLRRQRRFTGKAWLDRLLTACMPGGFRMRTSRMNFLGLGAPALAHLMRHKRVASVEELFATARELGVRVVACQMSMDVMGIAADELVDGIEYAGAATCVAHLQRPGGALFI